MEMTFRASRAKHSFLRNIPCSTMYLSISSKRPKIWQLIYHASTACRAQMFADHFYKCERMIHHVQKMWAYDTSCTKNVSVWYTVQKSCLHDIHLPQDYKTAFKWMPGTAVCKASVYMKACFVQSSKALGTECSAQDSCLQGQCIIWKLGLYNLLQHWARNAEHKAAVCTGSVHLHKCERMICTNHAVIYIFHMTIAQHTHSISKCTPKHLSKCTVLTVICKESVHWKTWLVEIIAKYFLPGAQHSIMQGDRVYTYTTGFAAVSLSCMLF